MMCMLVAHVRRVLRDFLCADRVWSGCTVSNMSVITSIVECQPIGQLSSGNLGGEACFWHVWCGEAL